jgi:hypothetical protein
VIDYLLSDGLDGIARSVRIPFFGIRHVLLKDMSKISFTIFEYRSKCSNTFEVNASKKEVLSKKVMNHSEIK